MTIATVFPRPSLSWHEAYASSYLSFYLEYPVHSPGISNPCYRRFIHTAPKMSRICLVINRMPLFTLLFHMAA